RLRDAVGARRALRAREIPARQKIVALGLARPRAVGIAPYLVLPSDDAPLGGETGAKLHGHGGAIRLPGELVVAHPLQPDRPAGQRTREQSRIEGRVVGTIVPVAARALRVGDADGALGHAERLGEI